MDQCHAHVHQPFHAAAKHLGTHTHTPQMNAQANPALFVELSPQTS